MEHQPTCEKLVKSEIMTQLRLKKNILQGPIFSRKMIFTRA